MKTSIKKLIFVLVVIEKGKQAIKKLEELQKENNL